jgi:hypothetical protein
MLLPVKRSHLRPKYPLGFTHTAHASRTADLSEIVVTFTTAALDPAGSYDCPDNDHVPVEVDLGEARGDRPIVDGGCRDSSAASTLLCRSEIRRVDPSGSPMPLRN